MADVFTTGNYNGSWFDAADWSSGVPNADTDASASNQRIQVGSFYNPEGNAAANSLSLDNGASVFINAFYLNHTSGVFYLTITNSLDLVQSTIDGAGNLVVGGVTSLLGGSSVQTNGLSAHDVIGNGTIDVGHLSIASASSTTTIKLSSYSDTTVTADTRSLDALLVVSLPAGQPNGPPPPTYDTINLPNLAYQAGETVSVVQAATGSPLYSVTLRASDGQAIYTFSQVEGSAGEPIGAMVYAGPTGTSVNIACYCRGTLILTDRGDLPVEALSIGDTAITSSGQCRLVRWIGRRSYAGRFLAANPGVQPIRFRAGSLGACLPRRDLLVSPEHAMLLDDVLIPARCLVNGTSITQQRGSARVDYIHVELDFHDVLLAEGAPSESFLDDDSRGMFHNAREFAALYPDAPKPVPSYAPRVTDGYQLEAIRQRLAVVAGDMAGEQVA